MNITFATLIGLLLLGCSDVTADPVATDKEAILWSTTSDSSDDAVVKLLATHATQIQNCTGTLVAPNLVLTARHCVADFTAGNFTCNSDGDQISGPGGETGTAVAPEKVTVQTGLQPVFRDKSAVGAKIFDLPTTTICRNDIALVLLDRNLTDKPIPIRLHRNSTRGERMRGVGYGTYEGKNTGVRHTKSDLPITKVGKSQYESAPDDIPPRTFQIDGGGFCIGDSGGPAISEQGAVMGVFSKATGECTSTDTANHFAETGPYWDELMQVAFQASGFEPVLEPDAFVGAAGASGNVGVAGAAGSAADLSSAGTSAGGTDSSSADTSPGYAGNVASAGAGSEGLAGFAGSDSILSAGTTARSSPSGGSPPQSTTTTKSSFGGTSLATAAMNGGVGGSSSDASTEEEIIFDAAPPKGGACNCQFGQRSPRSFAALGLLALMLWRRRTRIRARADASMADN